MKKRIVSMFLVVCMICSMFPQAVFAAEAGVSIDGSSIREDVAVCENHDDDNRKKATQSDADDDREKATQSDAKISGDVSVAQIDDTEYETLQLAVDAVTDGETIELLTDADEGIVIPDKAESFTLDLKGRTLSTDGEASITYYGSGTLRISDSAGGGNVENTTEDGIAISNAAAGTVDVSGGTVLAENIAISSNSAGVVKISGMVTVSGGTQAIDQVLELTDDAGKAIITASTTEADGTGAVEIAKDDIDTSDKIKAYKYLKFEPVAVLADYTITQALDFSVHDAPANCSAPGIGHPEGHNCFTWEKDTQTLTLNSISVKATEGTGIKLIPHSPTTIVVNGRNHIEAGDSNSGDCYALYNGDITFEGDGLLEAVAGVASYEGKSMGIYCGNMTISSGTIIAKGGTGTASYGINAGDCRILGGSLEATAGKATGTDEDAYSSSCGVFSWGYVVVTGGMLAAAGGETVNATGSYGIYATGAISVLSGTVSANSAADLGYGMWARNIEIGNRGEYPLPTVKAWTQDYSNSASRAVSVNPNLKPGSSVFRVDIWENGKVIFWVPTKAPTPDNGEALDFTKLKTDWHDSSGTYGGTIDWDYSAAGSTLTLNGVSISNKNTDTTGSSYALHVPDHTTIVLNGTNILKASGEEADFTYGILCPGNLTIKGNGVLHATGGDAVAGSYGISAHSIHFLDMPDVKAKSSKVERGETCGISVTNGMILSGGLIDASAGDWGQCGFSYGIDSYGDIILGNDAGSGLIMLTAFGMTSAMNRAPVLKPSDDIFTVTGAWNALEVKWIIPQGVPDDGEGGSHASSGGSNSDNTITQPAADKPDNTTKAEIKVEGKVDKNGSVTADITEKDIMDAYNKASADAKKTGTEANGITLLLKVSTGSKTANSVTFHLPKTVQDIIISKGILTTVVAADNPAIQIGMDLAAIKEINNQAKADVNITAARADNSKLPGSRSAFDLSVSGGTSRITGFGTGRVSVVMPYTLGADEKAGFVQAVYADENGRTQWISDSVYDEAAKVLRFRINQCSTYGVGYKSDVLVFTDIGGHWAQDAMEFVTSRRS